MRSRLLLAALLLLLATVAQANVVLPDVISGGMILQRDRAVPIWGTADAGERITVRFAGEVKKAIADGGGKWLVRLDAMRASATPATMSIEGNNKLELKDILVG